MLIHACKGNSIMSTAGYPTYVWLAIPQLIRFLIHVAKVIIKHQHQIRSRRDKADGDRRHKWTQAGCTGALTTLITHNLRGRDTVSLRHHQKEETKGVWLPPLSYRQPLSLNFLCKRAITLVICKSVFVVFLNIMQTPF